MTPIIGKVLRTTPVLLILVGLKTGLPHGQAQLRARAPATVTLRVLDSYGKPLEYKVESFHAKDQPNLDLAAQFEGLTFRQAVQGEWYEFRLAPVSAGREYPAFRRSIAIPVGEALTLAVFSVPKAILEPDRGGPWPVTRLVIQPVPRGEDIWVNVRPAYGPDISGTDTSETAVVNEDGAFNLHGTHGGLYVVTIYQGGTILQWTAVEIPQFAPSKPIEVRLDSGTGSMKAVEKKGLGLNRLDTRVTRKARSSAQAGKPQ